MSNSSSTDAIPRVSGVTVWPFPLLQMEGKGISLRLGLAKGLTMSSSLMHPAGDEPGHVRKPPSTFLRLSKGLGNLQYFSFGETNLGKDMLLLFLYYICWFILGVVMGTHVSHNTNVEVK